MFLLLFVGALLAFGVALVIAWLLVLLADVKQSLAETQEQIELLQEACNQLSRDLVSMRSRAVRALNDNRSQA